MASLRSYFKQRRVKRNKTKKQSEDSAEPAADSLLRIAAVESVASRTVGCWIQLAVISKHSPGGIEPLWCGTLAGALLESLYI